MEKSTVRPLLGERADHGKDRLARLRIHAGGGFIEDHELGIVHQGSGEVEPPLHPSGIAADGLLGALAKPHLLEQRLDAAGESRARVTGETPEESQVFAGGQLAIEGDALRGDPHPPADRGIGRSPAEHLDLAAIGPDQPERELDRRRFARAIGAEQGEDDASRHLEIEPGEREGGAEALSRPRQRSAGGETWLDMSRAL